MYALLKQEDKGRERNGQRAQRRREEQPLVAQEREEGVLNMNQIDRPLEDAYPDPHHNMHDYFEFPPPPPPEQLMFYDAIDNVQDNVEVADDLPYMDAYDAPLDAHVNAVDHVAGPPPPPPAFLGAAAQIQELDGADGDDQFHDASDGGLGDVFAELLRRQNTLRPVGERVTLNNIDGHDPHAAHAQMLQAIRTGPQNLLRKVKHPPRLEDVDRPLPDIPLDKMDAASLGARLQREIHAGLKLRPIGSRKIKRAPKPPNPADDFYQFVQKIGARREHLVPNEDDDGQWAD